MERKVLEATNPVFSFIRGKIEFMEVISPSLKELDSDILYLEQPSQDKSRRGLAPGEITVHGKNLTIIIIYQTTYILATILRCYTCVCVCVCVCIHIT